LGSGRNIFPQAGQTILYCYSFYSQAGVPSFQHKELEYCSSLHNTIFPLRKFQKTQILKSIKYLYIRGITLPIKTAKRKKVEGFAFHIKFGEYEVEIQGTPEEVNKTLKDLPNIVANVHKAFESVKPKTVATLTVKTEPTAKSKETPKAPAQTYPKITDVVNCKEAVLRLLETDWGKWRPRTMEELKDAMKASKITYTKRTWERTLNKLAEKGMVRRWNTNTGFVYILAEKKPPKAGSKVQ
jgi:acylphosphatase